ncbi:MAG: peroxidase-related enzyme [Steroidobacterales bacterium]
MPQPKHVTALGLRPAKRSKLSPDIAKYFAKCDEKLGFVPNVLRAYSFSEARLRPFIDMYNDLMLADSGLTKLEREMIAVVVSSANHCYYCLTAHGAAVRQLSGDPELGELLVMNYRSAPLARRHRVMLDVAHRLTVKPAEVGAAERRALRRVGFKARDIWDIAAVAAFFNMSNRVATLVDMMPNREYHSQAR